MNTLLSEIERELPVGTIFENILFNDVNNRLYGIGNKAFCRIFFNAYTLPKRKGLFCKVGEVAASFYEKPKRKSLREWKLKKITHNKQETLEFLKTWKP